MYQFPSTGYYPNVACYPNTFPQTKTIAPVSNESSNQNDNQVIDLDKILSEESQAPVSLENQMLGANLCSLSPQKVKDFSKTLFKWGNRLITVHELINVLQDYYGKLVDPKLPS